VPAPVSSEAVLKANPEAIIGGQRHDAESGIQIWRKVTAMEGQAGQPVHAR
jgi:iron complex transport system substrate-binding protein